MRHPRLRCIALLDAADPGFPSFIAVHASHLCLFGRLLPGEFVNQGGDPYLFELYRSIGAADVCGAVTVHNSIGGMEGSVFAGPGVGSSSAPPPRYTRVPLPLAQLADLLASARARLLAASPGAQRRLQVAVAVPTYRVNTTSLGRILDAAECSDPSADVRRGCASHFFSPTLVAHDVAATTHKIRLTMLCRVLIQVDNPEPSPEALAWLRVKQASRLHHLRVRLAATNGGAAAARNRLLDEALGCDLIVFFDDDVQPNPGCLDAYVAACQRWPQETGFAGPTVLPRAPTRLLPTAIHMSDVSFFWEAPATLGWSHVPWAVTANMAVRQTVVRFRDGFPKTGMHLLHCCIELFIKVPYWALHA